MAFPDAVCGLNFENPFRLLIATILSAQSSDTGVNRITPGLWKSYPGPGDLAAAALVDLERKFRPLGLFRNKARNVRNCAKKILEIHGGEVPATLGELEDLPGVGRKTARVVLGECFGAPGIVVDTHMARVSKRLGFTEEENPLRIEHDLASLVPLAQRTLFSHRIIALGREICHSRKPRCGTCPLAPECPSAHYA